jgi:phenylacetic acid degradation operon negative regulatory protein
MQTNVSGRPAELELRPLSARSVVLSLLLGMHPPELPVKDLVRHVEAFGVAGSTLRAALSRMVSAGDLRRADAVYGLSDRLLDRQRRQDESVHPETRPWHGDWEMVVVTATGRAPAERANLRARLSALRLAELREGVWLRPANLRHTRPPNLGPTVQHFTVHPDRPAGGVAAWGPVDGGLETVDSATENSGAEGLAAASSDTQGLDAGDLTPRDPTTGESPAEEPATGDHTAKNRPPRGSAAEDPAAADHTATGPTTAQPAAAHSAARDLAASLWPLDAWAATAVALLVHIERTRQPADRFTALAAAVRHLLADPVLPSELLPEGWPGPELRATYTAYRRELVETVLGRTDR